jgi:hypothetical protein
MLFPLMGELDPALLTQMVVTAIVAIWCLTNGPARPSM